MIPREILKKIRHAETPARVVLRLHGSRSFKPPPKFGRVAFGVEHGNNTDKVRLNVEVNAVFPEYMHSGLANIIANKPKAFGAPKNPLESGMDFGLESVSQSRLLLLIPTGGILKLLPGFSLEDYFPRHARRFSRRPLSSAQIVSHLMPFSGLRESFSARLSKTAICSGGSSSSNSSLICWATSYCSSKDNRRNCSSTSAAFMPLLYRGRENNQAPHGVPFCVPGFQAA